MAATNTAVLTILCVNVPTTVACEMDTLGIVDGEKIKVRAEVEYAAIAGACRARTPISVSDPEHHVSHPLASSWVIFTTQVPGECIG